MRRSIYNYFYSRHDHNKTVRPRVYIETTSLTGKGSGVSHNTLELIKAIENSTEFKRNYETALLMPFDRVRDVRSKGINNIKIKRLPLPLVLLNILWKLNLLPPLDLFYGKGIYIFPNYKNLPLLYSKNITFVHDVSFVLYPEYTSPKNLKYLTSNIDRWVRRANIIATLSKSSKEGLVKNLNISQSKIVVVPCGVDRKVYYRRAENEVNDALNKFSLSGIYFLYLGNIEPRKNVIGILNAFEQVLKKHRDISLLLIGGGGWLNKSIETKIETLKNQGANIIRPGFYVKDGELPAIYSGALALVYPSFYEGFGLPPLQAMACGTPVIVSHNSSIPEVVNGAGIYVNPKSESSIKHAMELVLDTNHSDELNSKVKIGLEQASKYTWENSAKKLLQAMESIK